MFSLRTAICWAIALATATLSNGISTNHAYGQETLPIADLVHIVSKRAGVSTDLVAEYLALGTPDDGGERTLVRWKKSSISIGMHVAKTMPAVDLLELTRNIEGVFSYVHRRADFCLRPSTDTNDLRSLESYKVKLCPVTLPTDIDIVIGYNDDVPLSSLDSTSLPSAEKNRSLGKLWTRARETLRAWPERGACETLAIDDPQGKEIQGAATYIRVPSAGVGDFASLQRCSVEQGYRMLGFTPIIKTEQHLAGAPDPDLLQLLYSDEFETGDSLTLVREKIRAAVKQ